jgi:hypothetical protein
MCSELAKLSTAVESMQLVELVGSEFTAPAGANIAVRFAAEVAASVATESPDSDSAGSSAVAGAAFVEPCAAAWPAEAVAESSETAAGSSWLGMPATAESEAVTEPRAMPAAVSSQAKSGSVHSSAGQPKQNWDESLHSAGWMHPWLPKTRSTAIGLLLAVETCATMTATIERAMRAATLR